MRWNTQGREYGKGLTAFSNPLHVDFLASGLAYSGHTPNVRGSCVLYLRFEA
jgi:hypothetical protein